ncbi:hypothetical protein ACHAXA_008512 [Cyclostephanos tholiformis]|uniref:Pep3/Vps18 beta-propeller domain-containing protein n=1 Tax=Cyclostephanos tholiformis TaxID=382380 RepID=A0ABD3RR88_9STRA
MSTNPFDYDDDDGGGALARGPRRRHQHQQHLDRHTVRDGNAQQQQQQQHQQQQHQQQRKQMQRHSPPTERNRQYLHNHQRNQQRLPTVAPIFSARGVEWPLPSAFAPAQYRSYRRESRASGVGIGISSSGLAIVNNIDASSSSMHGAAVGHRHHRRAGSIEDGRGVGGASAFASRAGGGDGLASPSDGIGGGAVGGGSMAGGGGGGYGGLTGLMGRVLGASSASASGGSRAASNIANEIEEADMNSSATRPVWPPRPHCVAAANGWIVAVVECGPPHGVPMHHPPHPSSSSSSSSSSSAAAIVSPVALASLMPPLRLVSRWNVRRGTTLGSDGDRLIPLPPPVRPVVNWDAAVESSTASGGAISGGGGSSSSSNAGDDPNFGRIMRTFVDPTGCHVFLSARNGEAYYLHSTSKVVTKLSGFGPGVDGSFSSSRAGATLAEATGGGGGDGTSVVQTGLTPGSYVTAVGWDR